MPRLFFTITAMLVALVAVFLLIDKARNEIEFGGRTADGLEFQIIDTDQDRLSRKVFRVHERRVNLGWGYSMKGQRILYRIVDDHGIQEEGDLVLSDSGITRLYLPQLKSPDL